MRDVPILWLPFIFQDVRPGRHSGILVPQFGLNDLVRPTRTYNRQITNIGYYWAPNDYIDVTARLDWFANRYVQYGVGRAVPLAQPVHRAARRRSTSSGRSDGASALTLRWDHRQEFNLSTSLNFSLNYASNNAVVRQNAIDPLQNTQQITSSLNYSKRFGWGTLTLGGNRRQSITRRQRATALSGGHAVAGADRGRHRTSPGRPGSASPTTPRRRSRCRRSPGSSPAAWWTPSAGPPTPG